jgi:DNA polymerase III gamma/tau subunit
MPMIGLILSQYWKPLALVVLIAAALAYRSVLIHQRDEARAQVAQLTAEATALRTSNQALGASIAQQNAAVTELKARADAALNTMAANETAALRAGASAQGQAQQQARALIGASIDANSGCLGAIDWGNAQAAELSSW